MNRKKKKILIVILALIVIACILFFCKSCNNKLEISIMDDNNLLKLVEVKKGTTLKDIEKPSIEGKEFLYWEVDGVRVDDNYKITKGIKLNAVFKEQEEKECKVTYEIDESTIVEDSVKCGEKVQIPATILEKLANNRLMYWEVDGEKFDVTQPITKDIKLKAVWGEKQYTILFDSQGGSKVGSQTVTEKEKVKQPTNPTKEGYTFVEWQLDNKKYDFNSEVTANITLTAVWKQNSNAVVPNTNTNNNSGTASNSNANNNTSSNTTPATPPAVQKYTVSFNSNGGSSVASQTVEKGRTATKPANPTKSGYTFVEWQLNGKAYNFSTAVTGNITLTAVWRENQKTYTIKISKIDDYSPDRVLTVYENGTKITVKSIKYTDGTLLCSGSNTTVNVNDITGETAFKVELNNGQIVTASVS